MALNVGELFAGLSFKVDDSGARKFDSDVDRLREKARQKIEAEAGIKVDERGFEAYHRQLDRAARRAKERDAFKATLGADFDARAFNAFQRETDRARAQAAKAIEQDVRANVDKRSFSVADASMEALGRSFRKLFEQSAKITVVGLGAQAMSAAAAGATALASALAPLSGALAAYPALGSAAGQGLGVFKLATAGLGDGLQAAAEGGKAWEDALKKLTPQQAEFIRSIRPVIDHVKGLQATAREGFLPGAERGILAANRNFGVLNDGVGRTSRVLGGLAEQAGKLLGSRGFGRDMDTQMRRNDTTIRRLGDAGLHLFDALRHVTIAAGPLVEWMTRSIDHGAKLVDVWAKQGRESGKLAHFFDETRTAMSRVVHIGGDLATAFFNIGKAGKPLGDDILVNLVKAAEAFKDWTASARGQNAIRKWFDDAKPAVDELGGLVVDAAKAFGRLGSGKQVAPLLHMIRTDLLPVLEEVVDNTTKSFGPPFLEAVKEGLRLFGRIAGSSGPLVQFTKLLGIVLGGINDIIDRVPVIGTALSGAIAAGGIYGALRIAATLSGLTRVIGLLRTARGVAATTGAVSAVAGAGGAAAGAGGAAARGGAAGSAVAFAKDIASRFPVAAIATAIAAALAKPLRDTIRGASPTGDFGSGKIASVATSIQRFNTQLERLDSIGDKKGADRLARQFDRLVDSSGKFRGSARDVDRLTGAAKDLADEGGTMERTLNRALDRAGAHFRDFRRTGSNNLQGIRHATSDNMHFIRRTLGEDSAAGKEALARNFRLARSAIRTAMQDGRVSVREGLREIQRLMRAELKSYGITGGVASSIIKHGDIKGAPETGGGGAQRGGWIKRAMGGWIGARGMVSDDVVPIAPGALAAFGEYLAVGSDGRKAVLNRHQAPVADLMLASGGYPTLDQGADLSVIEKALAPLGGLNRLFATITRPHMFQGGGIVPVPGFPGERAASSVIPAIMSIARQFKLVLTDAFGAGHKSPGHTRYGTAADFAGPDANMDAAVRALVGQGYLVGYDGRFGSKAWPGHGPSYVAGGNAHLHVELGGKGAALGAAVGTMLRRITAPRTGSRGALGAIAQGALNAATRGANQRLERAAATSLAVPVAGGGTGSGDVVRDFRRALQTAGATPVERLALFEAGIVESGLRNLPYGDRDSVGALQQRPSQGWTGLRDPYRAALEFLAHARGLRPWSGSAGQLAQAVQRSAYPGRYDAVAGQARQYLQRGGKVKDKLTKTVGKATAGLIRKVRPLQTDRSERFETLIAHTDAWDQDYSRWERRFNITDEELVDADTGAVNVAAVKRKAHELARLIAIRRRIEDELEKAQRVVKRIIASYRHVIRGLRNSLKHAKRKERSGIKSYIKQYEGRVDEWKAKQGEVGDSLFDTRTDLMELRGERREVLATKAAPRETDTGDTAADFGSDVGGGGDFGGGEPASTDDTATPADTTIPDTTTAETRAPTPQEIAAAAITEIQNFGGAIQELLRGFGSNIIPPGTAQLRIAGLQAMPAMMAATAPVPMAAPATALLSSPAFMSLPAAQRTAMIEAVRAGVDPATNPFGVLPFMRTPGALGPLHAALQSGFNPFTGQHGTLSMGAGGPGVGVMNVNFAAAPASVPTFIQQLRFQVENGA